MFSPDVMEGGGDAIEGVFVSSPDTSKFGPDYEAKFKTAYMAKFGSEPLSIFHAHAYDAMNMFLACVEKVATGDKEGGDMLIGRQAMRDCMYGTANFTA